MRASRPILWFGGGFAGINPEEGAGQVAGARRSMCPPDQPGRVDPPHLPGHWPIAHRVAGRVHRQRYRRTRLEYGKGSFKGKKVGDQRRVIRLSVGLRDIERHEDESSFASAGCSRSSVSTTTACWNGGSQSCSANSLSSIQYGSSSSLSKSWPHHIVQRAAALALERLRWRLEVSRLVPRLVISPGRDDLLSAPSQAAPRPASGDRPSGSRNCALRLLRPKAPREGASRRED
jgi:hypothetical protein